MELTIPTPENSAAQPILVVEDNPDCRESLRMLLQLWGYRVETASDGAEGVKKALSLRPLVALVDIGLPGLDGFQVAKQLRNLLGDQILLIAQTAYSQPEDLEKGRAAGFDAWLVKPLNPEELSFKLLVAAAHSVPH